MAPVLDEQSRRRFAAAEAQALGRGGVSLMAGLPGWRAEQFIADLTTFGLTIWQSLDVFGRRVAGGKRR